MSREMWEVVETKAGKAEMADTKGESEESSKRVGYLG